MIDYFFIKKDYRLLAFGQFYGIDKIRNPLNSFYCASFNDLHASQSIRVRYSLFR